MAVLAKAAAAQAIGFMFGPALSSFSHIVSKDRHLTDQIPFWLMIGVGLSFGGFLVLKFPTSNTECFLLAGMVPEVVIDKEGSSSGGPNRTAGGGPEICKDVPPGVSNWSVKVGRATRPLPKTKPLDL